MDSQETSDLKEGIGDPFWPILIFTDTPESFTDLLVSVLSESQADVRLLRQVKDEEVAGRNVSRWCFLNGSFFLKCWS